MNIRELVTRFGFSLDQAQLNKVDAAVNNVKQKLDEVSKTVLKPLIRPVVTPAVAPAAVPQAAPAGASRYNPNYWRNKLNPAPLAPAVSPAPAVPIPSAANQSWVNSMRQRVLALTTDTRKYFGNLRQQIQDANRRAAEETRRSTQESLSNLRQLALAWASFASIARMSRIADDLQSLRARIGLLPQTITDAGEAFDTITARASRARTSVFAYGQLYVRLAGATKEYLQTQEQVLTITDAVSNALIIGGANTVEAESAILQLSQAFQKGRLDGDEFRTFMEAMSTDFKDKLAAQLGTTQGKLYDLSAAGKLTARDLAEAFTKMAPELEAQMLKIPLTIGRATMIVGNKFSLMIDRMNRDSMAVTKIAAFIVKSFDYVERGVYGLRDAFDGFGNMLRFVGVLLGTVLGLKAIGALIALKNLSTEAKLLKLAFLGSVAGVLALGVVLDDLYTYFKGGDSVLGPWIERMREGFRLIKQDMQDAWNYYVNTFGRLGVWRDKMYDKIRGVVGLDPTGAFASRSAYDPGVVARQQAIPPRTVTRDVTMNFNVPPGTSREQAEFIRGAAMRGMQEEARIISTVAP